MTNYTDADQNSNIELVAIGILCYFFIVVLGLPVLFIQKEMGLALIVIFAFLGTPLTVYGYRRAKRWEHNTTAEDK